MTDRSDLVRAIHAAGDGASLSRAVAALDGHDRARADSLQADRELDLGARLAAQRLTPVPLHERHTAATDWLADAEQPAGLEYRTAMIAEASAWYGRLEQAVREDPAELAEQARGRARTLASAHGSLAGPAEREFLAVVGYLSSARGASGLPQIDQVTDANNQPAATPYPTEVFPTFGEDQDEYNGVETDNHQSGISSQQAPLLQQVVQQDASGSGFGSGPERPDMHTTRFDTADSYAEVPLGAPGQVPVAPAGTDQMASSHPSPVAGTDQDAGADRRQAAASLAGHSGPDPFGYRWPMTTVVDSPFHERCAGAHWPDQACGSRQHTASVAIGYQMNLDQARRRAQCEEVGVREGLRAVTAAATADDLGAWHNRVARAWGASDRTADDTAVLHGFMAVVRPVLAEMTVRAGGSCEACRGGDCGQCAGTGCSCGHGGRKTAARGLAGGGGVTEAEREGAPHHLPGPGDKFPVGSAADVENAKHDIGRTSEPRAKVVRYINDMAREYHVAPVGGGQQKAAARRGA